jgi:pilus assembly protein CpaC
MYTQSSWRRLASLAVLWLLPSAVLGQDALAPPPPAQNPGLPLVRPSVVYKIQASDERLEMIVHTSRILTMEQKISQTNVGNPDMLELTALSPNQVQISAKATGVTQVNLWDENKRLFTIDVLVVGDARELNMVLRTTFPGDALKVTPVASSVMISGYVEKNEHIERIIQLAEQYYPKVINNMTVGGVQQVTLHVKVMEVSRTKLRQLGFDWAKITGTNFVSSSPAGLLSDFNPGALTSPPNLFRTAAPGTFAFNVGGGNSAFFGVLQALRQDNLMKIMSEPVLTTSSGQPAFFLAGGKIPVPTPQSLGTLSIEWQPYGTQIKFVPVVLGNGKIKLDVDPDVSELDNATSTTIQGTTVPGIRQRSAHATLELMAGQTMAIAGLVEFRLEAGVAGLPWISDVPYLGTLFSAKKEVKNEVELLILVTPELVEPLDADEVPPCGPGMQTTSPSDWEFYLKQHIEVPKCPPSCPPGANGDCRMRGDNAGDAAPTGTIINRDEMIPTPAPAGSPEPSSPQNRYSPSKPASPASNSPPGSRNGPPGFIGPVGYDVVK